ncbi:MAG: (d)CMP kinase [Bacteroidales bacterium]
MQTISIAGDLGSGKSSVAKRICEKLPFEYFSTGMLQRKLAAEKGMNTLELNYFSETTNDVDNYIDAYLKNIDKSSGDYVLDSRLAWFFVKRSFKVYLSVKPEIAAQRVLSDIQRINEPEANDLESRIQTLLERQEVENRRFKKLYNIDCRDFSNYNLVLDTSDLTIDQTVDLIIAAIDPKGAN